MAPNQSKYPSTSNRHLPRSTSCEGCVFVPSLYINHHSIVVHTLMPTMKGSTAVSDPSIPSQRNALREVLVQLLPCRTLTCRSMLTLSICQTSRSNHHDTYEPLGVPLFFRGIDRCGTDLARRAVVVLRRRYQSQSLLSGSSPALDRRNGTSWQSKSVVQRTPTVSTHHLKAVASSCRECLRIYLEQSS
jgi:hypothetical protein